MLPTQLFVLNTQHLYLSALHAGSKHRRCWRTYPATCFKRRGNRPGVPQEAWRGGMYRGPRGRWGPLKGVRGCFLRWIRQCVCPLSNPVRRPANSNTIPYYSSSRCWDAALIFTQRQRVGSEFIKESRHKRNLWSGNCPQPTLPFFCFVFLKRGR